MRIVDLKVDYIDRPLGLESNAPRLSWRMQSSRRGVRQRKYRIVVASTEQGAQRGRGDLWDSGEREGSCSFNIEYQGAALSSRQRCWWRVEVVDDRGDRAHSAVSTWEMGLLSPDDWSAQWLLVEDASARADRETGLHWIGGSSVEPAAPSRKFRLSLPLITAAKDGVLVLGSRSDLLGLWIDGRAVPIEPRPQYFFGPRPLQQFTLGPLDAGDHVIAVEVIAKGGPTASLNLNAADPHLDAITAFLRLELQDGRSARRGSAEGWRTSVTRDAGWNEADHLDRQWERAQVITEMTAQPWPATPAMHLRREFTVSKEVAQARLYATALGAYEARLNSRRVGDALLMPEATDFRKRALYRTYDVTELLREGGNVLGFTVGDGWYASELAGVGRYAWGLGARRVFAQLELTYSDGSRETIPTGRGWRLASSPIVRAEIYDGEHYDARLSQDGWDACGFDGSAWEDAQLAAAPPCQLTAQVSAPIRATQVVKPRSITNPGPGIWVVDFGQNFAGWCRLHAKGETGTRLEMKFGETLLPSGRLDRSNLRGAKQTDVFILRGDAARESFEPHFTYHGFRYVEIAGLAAAPDADSLEAVVIHSDLALTGTLDVDHPLVQRLWRNALWSQRSNFFGIATDCSQRDERFGWFGDAGVFWDTAAFNMDIAAFTRRQLQNAADGQTPWGTYTNGAPFVFPSIRPPAPGWADAPIIMTWTAWRHYGDTAIIARNWTEMSRYVRFIEKHNPDGIWRNERSDIGDWMATDERYMGDPTTPHELIGTAYWAHSTDLMAQMAEAMGRHDEAMSWRKLHALIRQAFTAAYVKADGRIGNESQTSYVLALKYGLVADELRSQAAARLVSDIRRRGGALSTGFLGTQYLLDVLVDAGYADVAHDLLLRTDYPSWGYMIAQDGTTVWEGWNGKVWAGPKGEQMPNSYNHFAFGAVAGFLFRRIAGIDAASPGFEAIVIHPILDPRLRRGGGVHDSMMGRIRTNWTRKADGAFELDVTIPANATAHVHLPAGSGSRIREGRTDITRRGDMRLLSRSDKSAVVEIGSGNYRFFISPA